jgi:hypothetical protein
MEPEKYPFTEGPLKILVTVTQLLVRTSMAVPRDIANFIKHQNVKPGPGMLNFRPPS